MFNRITFSGTAESGDFSKAAFEKRFTISSLDRVKFLSSILNDTAITNYDFQKVIEKEGDNVFIFLDPPYYSATKSALYGKNGKELFISNYELIEKSAEKERTLFDEMNEILPRTKAIRNAGLVNKSKVYAIK